MSKLDYSPIPDGWDTPICRKNLKGHFRTLYNLKVERGDKDMCECVNGSCAAEVRAELRS